MPRFVPISKELSLTGLTETADKCGEHAVDSGVREIWMACSKMLLLNRLCYRITALNRMTVRIPNSINVEAVRPA